MIYNILWYRSSHTYVCPIILLSLVITIRIQISQSPKYRYRWSSLYIYFNQQTTAESFILKTFHACVKVHFETIVINRLLQGIYSITVVSKLHNSYFSYFSGLFLQQNNQVHTCFINPVKIVSELRLIQTQGQFCNNKTH